MTTDHNNPKDIEALATSIVSRTKRIDAAIQLQLADIREFDVERGWELHGAKNCPQWLSQRIGLGASAARERVRIAHALGKLQLIDQALAAGEISFSKVRAITRVATPETESMLLSVAKRTTGAQLERFCRALRKSGAARAWQDRFVRKRSIADTGMVRIEIQLDSDEAETVWAALLAGARHAAATHEKSSTSSSTNGLADALHRFAEQLLNEQSLSDEAGVQTVESPVVTERGGAPATRGGEVAQSSDTDRPKECNSPSECSLDAACDHETRSDTEDPHRSPCDSSYARVSNACHGLANQAADSTSVVDGSDSARCEAAPYDNRIACSSEPKETPMSHATSSVRGDPPSVQE